MLFKDTADYFQEFISGCEQSVTSEKGHGRIETREYFLAADIDRLEQREEWINLRTLGMVCSKVIEGENTSEYVRYYITSLTDVNEFAYAVILITN